MKPLLLSAVLVTLASQAVAENVFISEYIEGSSYNKAIEVYNGSGASLDLSEYSLSLGRNGGALGSRTFELTGTLAAGEVFVICHTSADASIQAVADVADGSLDFNGDDSMALLHNETVIDMIGDQNGDPGSSWPVGSGSTANNTLVRMESILQGSSDWTVGATQWDVYPSNTFSYLGAHTVSGGSNQPPVITGVTQTPDPAMDGDAVSIEATIVDTDGSISNVDFVYHVDAGSDVSVTLTGVGDVYTGSVPAQLAGATVYYSFVATDDDTDSTTHSASYFVGSVSNINEGDLVINEIMPNPLAVDDSDGEWFEIHNTTAADIDMFGLTIADDGSDSFTINSSLIVPAGGYVIFAENDNSGTNGGLPTVDFLIPNPTQFALANTADELLILDGTTELDRVAWDTNSGWPYTNGHSLALTDPTLNNSDVANWLEFSDAQYGDGDYGTPRALNFSSVPSFSNFSQSPDGAVLPGETVTVNIDANDSNGSITSVTLYYSLDGGAESDIAMTEVVSRASYTAEIPGQLLGTQVSYRIVAVDNDMNSSEFGPQSYSVGGSQVSIAAVQAHSGDGVSLMEGQTVTITGIVSALAYAGEGSFFMQDSDAVLSGIQVYGANDGLAVGDAVTVTGEVEEYHDHTELLIESSAAYSVSSSGNALYGPVALTAAAASAEDYESMLVSVEDLDCLNLPNTYGEWWSATGNDSLMVDDLFGGFFSPTLGECYDLVGVIYFSYEVFRLQPREMSDLALCSGANLPPVAYDIEQDINLPTSSDPVSVSCIADDDTGLSSVELKYTVDGGAVNSVSMSTRSQGYEAVIPAQADGSVVEYWVYVTDTDMATFESAHQHYNVSDALLCDDVAPMRVVDADGEPVMMGQTVVICGIAATAYEFGPAGAAFIHTATGDICAYSGLVHTDSTAFAVGDELMIAGEIGFYNGLTEIVDCSVVTVLSSGNTLTPTVMTLAELNVDSESHEAKLVRVNGVTITDPENWPAAGSNGTVTLSQGTDTFTMFIDRDTNLNGTSAPVGEFDMIAVVGQYDYSSPYTEGYQLIPRFTADINPEASYECTDLSDLRVNDVDGIPTMVGDVVKVCGVVTSTNQLGAPGPATIQTDDGAIAIYDALVASDTLIALGDSIEAIGTVACYRGLTQITSVSEFSIINNGPALLGEIVTLADLLLAPEAYESRLVTLEEVELVDPENWPADGSSYNLTITDGTDTITMRVDADTNIDGSPVPSGSFDLTAVVGQYQYATPYDGGYQLLPRFLSDISQEQILPSPSVVITYNATTGVVRLDWDVVVGASNYKVYTCTGDPYVEGNWSAGQSTFGLNFYEINQPVAKTMFRVTAE